MTGGACPTAAPIRDDSVHRASGWTLSVAEAIRPAALLFYLFFLALRSVFSTSIVQLNFGCTIMFQIFKSRLYFSIENFYLFENTYSRKFFPRTFCFVLKIIFLI